MDGSAILQPTGFIEIWPDINPAIFVAGVWNTNAHFQFICEK